jgi:hydroxypyruvate isomerase
VLGFSANVSTLYRHLPFVERFAAATGDGFRSVEFWTTDEPDAVAQEVQRLGLQVSVVNVDGGPEPDNAGRLSDRAAVGRWRRRFDETLQLARDLGCVAINVPAGRDAAATAVGNLEWALERIDGEDVVLLLEPLSKIDRPGYLLPTFEDANLLRRTLGSPAELKILFDAYHLHQSSGDVVALFERSSEAVGHVQLADYPGRGAPGSGEIDLVRLLEAVASSSYRGWVGLEYLAAEETSGGLSWIDDVRHVLAGGATAPRSLSQS